MPDDHSKLVPLLPISNRTVKRLSADDSADSRVKVGHRQAFTARNAPPIGGAFCFVRTISALAPFPLFLSFSTGYSLIDRLFIHLNT